jgi:hypothetical protein
VWTLKIESLLNQYDKSGHKPNPKVHQKSKTNKFERHNPKKLAKFGLFHNMQKKFKIHSRNPEMQNEGTA